MKIVELMELNTIMQTSTEATDSQHAGIENVVVKLESGEWMYNASLRKFVHKEDRHMKSINSVYKELINRPLVDSSAF